MAISQSYLEKLSKTTFQTKVEETFLAAKNLVEQAIINISERNANVRPQDVLIYMQGSYQNNTNIFTASNLEIVVELQRTLSYDIDLLGKHHYSLVNNYFVQNLHLDYSVKNFKEDLMLELDLLTKHNIREKTRKTIIINEYKDLPKRVEILPAFSFVKHSTITNHSVEGILIWDNIVNSHIISFPKLHEHFVTEKDEYTNGNFKQIVRVFKSLRVILSQELGLIDRRIAPGYFIECMLFNVPNSLYTGTLKQMFVKILNYLRNCNLYYFNSANMQWALYGSAAEFWDIPHTKQYLHCLTYLWYNFEELKLKTLK